MLRDGSIFLAYILAKCRNNWCKIWAYSRGILELVLRAFLAYVLANGVPGHGPFLWRKVICYFWIMQNIWCLWKQINDGLVFIWRNGFCHTGVYYCNRAWQMASQMCGQWWSKMCGGSVLHPVRSSVKRHCFSLFLTRFYGRFFMQSDYFGITIWQVLRVIFRSYVWDIWHYLGAVIFYIKLLQMEHATKASRGILGHIWSTMLTPLKQRYYKSVDDGNAASQGLKIRQRFLTVWSHLRGLFQRK